jgi:hypothetical protein
MSEGLDLVLKLISELKEALDSASPAPSRPKSLAQTKLDECEHWVRALMAELRGGR